LPAHFVRQFSGIARFHFGELAVAQVAPRGRIDGLKALARSRLGAVAVDHQLVAT
jgi:hypothetical protein